MHTLDKDLIKVIYALPINSTPQKLQQSKINVLFVHNLSYNKKKDRDLSLINSLK